MAFRDIGSLKAMGKWFLENSYMKECKNEINQDQARA
jgi:hypothetical protein